MTLIIWRLSVREKLAINVRLNRHLNIRHNCSKAKAFELHFVRFYRMNKSHHQQMNNAIHLIRTKKIKWFKLWHLQNVFGMFFGITKYVSACKHAIRSRLIHLGNCHSQKNVGFSSFFTRVNYITMVPFQAWIFSLFEPNEELLFSFLFLVFTTNSTLNAYFSTRNGQFSAKFRKEVRSCFNHAFVPCACKTKAKR